MDAKILSKGHHDMITGVGLPALLLPDNWIAPWLLNCLNCGLTFCTGRYNAQSSADLKIP